MVAAGGQLELEARPEAVREARRWVGNQLAGSPLRDDALLIVSELVTNAVLHGSGTVLLGFERSGDSLRIEVRDRGSQVPRRKHYGLQAATGRGLELVESLARAWGVDEERNGKTVWAQLGADWP